MRISKQVKRDVTLSMYWLTFFALLFALVALRMLWMKNADLTQDLTICQHSFEVWSKQIESGKIILKFKDIPYGE